MINMGTAGTWKLRTQINSRQAVWRALEQRTGAKDPHPPNWPADAGLQISQASPSPVAFDPYAGHPVVRGPVLADPLDGRSSARAAEQSQHAAELAGRLREDQTALSFAPQPAGRGGVFSRSCDFRWDAVPVSQMNLARNTTRRVPSLYPLQLQMRSPDEVQEYHDAAFAVVFDPKETALLPLTGGDPEIYDLVGQRSPNFQPSLLTKNDWRMTKIPQVSTRVPDYCEANPGTVRKAKVNRLLRAIRNVPHNVSNYYLGKYQQVIRRLESLESQAAGDANADCRSTS